MRGCPEATLEFAPKPSLRYATLPHSIITLVPPSSNLFERGLELYASRPDKRYSLTDCISMTVMRDLDITEILTHDRDFENEGFTRLIK